MTQSSILKAVVLNSALLSTVATSQMQAQQAPVGPPEKKPAWDISAALGFTLTRGNSDTLLFTGNLLGIRKWERSELNVGADGTYGESKVDVNDGLPNESQRTAASAHGFVQYNWLFTPRVYGFGRFDALNDAVADIDYRFTLAPGAGYYFVRNETTFLRGEAGPGFVYERQGTEEKGYITVRLAERFEHKFNDKVKLWQMFEISPEIDNFDNYVAIFEIGVETTLTQKLSLRTYLQDTYDNEPAAGREKNDLKIVTALAYKL